MAMDLESPAVNYPHFIAILLFECARYFLRRMLFTMYRAAGRLKRTPRLIVLYAAL